jgi:uncharacterized membrane protein
MTALDRQGLWARLREAGLAQGDAPAPSAARAPWFVRVMLGIAGWIGALFLLGFVGVGFAFVMRNAAVSIAVGALVCAGAALLFRARAQGDFMNQFGLAVSLAGQALMGMGLLRLFGYSSTAAALAIALQQALLFALVPNFVHRVWTSWTAAFAVVYVLGKLGLHSFAPAAVTLGFLWPWLAEFDHPRRGELLRAAGYGLALAAVQTVAMHGPLLLDWMHGHGAPGRFSGELWWWLGNVASGLVLVWAVLRLLKREGVGLGEAHGSLALAGAGVLALISLKAPGVGPAVAILVTGFANGNRVLAGLGIVALLGTLSHYYYALHATLLEKSALLAGAGLALLAARYALQRLWPGDTEAKHA